MDPVNDGAAGPGEHDFAVTGSRLVYDGAIVALRVDDVAMPDGSGARREVVEHHAAVVIVAVDDSDRVTLVHQYRHPLGRRLWELPAGLMDVDGEPAVDCARRELVEEAGLTARRWSVLADLASSPGFTDETLRVYLAEGLEATGRPDAADEEADLVVTSVPLAEAVRMVLAGEIINAPAATGILALSAVRSGGGEPRAIDADAANESMPTAFAERVRARSAQ